MLNSAILTSPILNTFFAAQVKSGDKGFLSQDIKVQDLITQRGDVHHDFPKGYLQKKYNSRNDYNQNANFVYAQSDINIPIGNKAPKEYFKELQRQCDGGRIKYGNITDKDKLMQNLRKHCIPENILVMDIDDYFDFLEERRKLMANKIKRYYKSL
jgi:hypothetical protein